MRIMRWFLVLALVTVGLFAEEHHAQTSHYEFQMTAMGAFFEPDRLALSNVKPALRMGLSAHNADGFSFGGVYTHALIETEPGEAVNQSLEFWFGKEFEAFDLEWEAEAKVVSRDRVHGQNINYGELSLLAQKKFFWGEHFIAPFAEAAVLMPFRATEEFDDRLITRAGIMGHIEINGGLALEGGASFAHTTPGIPELPGESVDWKHYSLQLRWGNDHDSFRFTIPKWDRIVIPDYELDEDIWGIGATWWFE